jgi:hypothetical protein
MVCVLLVSGYLAACATTDSVGSTDDAGTRNCATHKLKLKVKSNDCVEKVIRDKDCDCDAEAVIVRVCDTVEWKVLGTNKKSISFDVADGSPFTWFNKGDSQKISGEVKAGAARDKPYKYTVQTDGLNCPLDPMIIVQP